MMGRLVGIDECEVKDVGKDIWGDRGQGEKKWPAELIEQPTLIILCFLPLVQMESSQLIHCRELVAHHLSALQSALPLNSVYVYRPLKHTLVTCDKGVFRLHPSSAPGPDFAKDKSKPEVPVRGTAAFYHHLPAASGCKLTSAKRKVEEMEVDDFYDGIKRLYNEDNAAENVGSVCGADLSRQEGHASPCPPLQPVSVM